MNQKQKRKEARKYLRLYLKLEQEINRLGNQIRRLQDRIDVKSPIITGMPRGGNPYTLEQYIADSQELLDFIADNYRKQQEAYKSIEKSVRQIEDPVRRIILRDIYFEDKGQAAIAHELGYSLSHVQHLHLVALDEIAEILKVSKPLQVDS